MSEREHADDPVAAAALHALGALDAADAGAVERRLVQGDAAFRAEAGAFAEVVGRLGLAAPPLAAAPAVRARMLDAVRAAARLTIVRADEKSWETTPAGTLARTLMRDPVARRATSLVSMRAGSVYPTHRHRETEELYILEGALDVHGHHLGAGDYCAALGGSVHRSAATAHGCRFLVSASEEDELVGGAEPSPRGLLFVPASRGTWTPLEGGLAVRRIAVDGRFGVATALVRMAAGSRAGVRGQQIYVLEGAARLRSGEALGAGDFCGTVAGTAEVVDSAAGCLLLVLAARDAIAQEGAP
jgi:anti-sigma factor ChrR (cupin superfamily)